MVLFALERVAKSGGVPKMSSKSHIKLPGNILHEMDGDVIKNKDLPATISAMDRIIRSIFDIHSDIPTEYYISKFSDIDVDITYHLCCGLGDEDFKIFDRMKNSECIEYITTEVCTLHTKIGAKHEYKYEGKTYISQGDS